MNDGANESDKCWWESRLWEHETNYSLDEINNMKSLHINLHETLYICKAEHCCDSLWYDMRALSILYEEGRE